MMTLPTRLRRPRQAPLMQAAMRRGDAPPCIRRVGVFPRIDGFDPIKSFGLFSRCLRYTVEGVNEAIPSHFVLRAIHQLPLCLIRIEHGVPSRHRDVVHEMKIIVEHPSFDVSRDSLGQFQCSGFLAGP